MTPLRKLSLERFHVQSFTLSADPAGPFLLTAPAEADASVTSCTLQGPDCVSINPAQPMACG